MIIYSLGSCQEDKVQNACETFQLSGCFWRGRKKKKRERQGRGLQLTYVHPVVAQKHADWNPGMENIVTHVFMGWKLFFFPPPLLWKTAGRHGHISAERLKLKIQHIIIWSEVKAAERKLFPEVKVPPNGVCIFNVTTEEKPWNCAGWCCSHWEILQPASWKQGRFCFPYILPHLCCQGSGC